MDGYSYTKDELITILHHHLIQESTLITYIEQLIEDIIGFDSAYILERADYEELRADLTAFDNSIRHTRMYLP